MKIAIFGNSKKLVNKPILEKLFSIIATKNADVFIEESLHDFIVNDLHLHPKIEGTISDNNFRADLVLSVGGDGSFLNTAARIGNKGFPIVGINAGRLGFLADISMETLDQSMQEIFHKQFDLEERTLLQIECGDSCRFDCLKYGLNEIAVMKQDSSSMISIHVSIDGEKLHSYQADGLIIATPTGSTAYSMSVGGPLVIPTANVLVLTPIASHSLNVRPLVVTDDCTISLRVEGRSANFLAAIDGRSEIFKMGTELKIRKADFKVKVLKQPGHTFFNTLRTKLMWGADIRGEM